MHSDRHITLFHNPQSRSRGVLVLLEELGADYSLQRLDLERGDQRDAAFLAINPMGKIPAITHGNSVVTEQAAIYQYLAGCTRTPGCRLRRATRTAAPICAGWRSTARLSSRP